jgi:transposase-like protein
VTTSAFRRAGSDGRLTLAVPSKGRMAAPALELFAAAGQIRKTIKTRGHFPNDDAALRLIWLAIQRAKNSWKTCYNWTKAMAVLRIHFGDRIPDNT